MNSFEKRSVIPTTMEHMLAFHHDARAIRWLTPPPIVMQLQRDTRTSLTDGEVEFVLWFGPLPVRWTALHGAGPIETSFQDRMLHGPMEVWVHQHIFRQVPGGVELIDHLDYQHRRGAWGIFTRLLFGGLPLRFLFFYRHLRTRQLVSNYRKSST